jgi:hypothetical protein
MGLSHALETRYRRRSIRGRPLYERESERITIMARSQRLQSRPNTLAQTNCHRSFFACNSAADHTFPLTRLTPTKAILYRKPGLPRSNPLPTDVGLTHPDLFSRIGLAEIKCRPIRCPERSRL